MKTLKDSIILNTIFFILFSAFLIYLLLTRQIDWILFLVTEVFMGSMTYIEIIRKKRELLDENQSSHNESMKLLNIEARGYVVGSSIFILLFLSIILWDKKDMFIAYPLLGSAIGGLLRGFYLSTELYRRRENLPKR